MLKYIDNKIPRAGVEGPQTSTNGVRFKIKTVHTGMRTAMFSPSETRTIRNTVLVLITRHSFNNRQCSVHRFTQ